jgi:hypothetical protein
MENPNRTSLWFSGYQAVYFQMSIGDMTFWRKTLVIGAAFHLHNYCIHEREHTCVANLASDIDPDRYNKPSYWEYLDPLRETEMTGTIKR